MKKTRCKATPDLFTKTNAQRQKEYRQRQKEKQGIRLDMYLDNDIHYMLEQLADSSDESMKATIARIIKKEYAEQL
uniref:hypothetical protein n=1 Tax=Psychrobacter sp. TaxID=56811 RepID=UPI0015988037|nr:hypothetical protein [Psychrobacter sp.]QJS05277.1 hypothetical protein [Psychrobacter sp.]